MLHAKYHLVSIQPRQRPQGRHQSPNINLIVAHASNNRTGAVTANGKRPISLGSWAQGIPHAGQHITVRRAPQAQPIVRGCTLHSAYHSVDVPTIGTNSGPPRRISQLACARCEYLYHSDIGCCRRCNCTQRAPQNSSRL